MKSHSVVSDSLRPHGLYSPWNSLGQNSLGQNTGVGSLSLLQEIFPTQGSNSGLPHCRWILYQLSHKGSPRILAWVAYAFSSGSSRPGNQTERIQQLGRLKCSSVYVYVCVCVCVCVYIYIYIYVSKIIIFEMKF